MNSPMCVGLENPQGTIDQFGKSTSGSLTEVDLIAAVTVPTDDVHHITAFTFGVLAGGAKTLFRLYYRTSSSGTWIQLNEFSISDYGALDVSVGVSHKIKAGEQWRVSGQQTTIARMSARAGGTAKKSDSRTAS